ncbi:MAG: hypothetical protein ACM37W_20915 [Actinomycetota bacterium]
MNDLKKLLIILGLLMVWMVKDLKLVDVVMGPVYGLGAGMTKTTDYWVDALKKTKYIAPAAPIEPNN